MFSGLIVVAAFYRFPSFASAMKDPFLRWPVLALIVSAAALATYPAGAFAQWLRGNLHKRRIIARLKELTPHEKHVLGRYLQEDNRTLNWDRGGGVVDLLCKDGVLNLIATNESDEFLPDVYAIEKTAWKYLRKYPELVDLEANPVISPGSGSTQ